MHRSGRLLGVAFVLAIALATIGCGGPARKPVYPVRGSVTFKGKSVAGAYLVFHPLASDVVEGPNKPRATVSDDGTFVVSTHAKNDGAPAGEYAVTVELRSPILLEGGETGLGKNALPGRYADPKSTKLRATVAAGPENVLPAFELTP